MNVFKKIREMKDKMYQKRLERAQKGAVALEVRAKKETALADVVKRQESAKKTIQDARRQQHPLLAKIGDNVKASLSKAHESNKKASFGNSNIFGSNTKADVPYFLKPTKSNSNMFASTSSQTPYWLKTQKKKR